jgi:RNA polymerase sigma-70 factor (family 1)
MAKAVSKSACREDAEELVQNSFLKLFQKKSLLDDDLSIFSYLFVALKNEVLNQHRNRLVREKYESYIRNNITEVDNTCSQELETNDLLAKLDLEVDKLPNKCKNVFLLSRKEHLSNKEITTVLNISLNTVEQHMRKALGKLRLSMKDLTIVFLLIVFR